MAKKKPSTSQNGSAGRRLAKFRKEAGLSQRDLAKQVNISQRMIAYYESKADRIPSDVLSTLADALGVSVDEILGRRTDKRRKIPTQRRSFVKRVKQLEDLSRRDREVVYNLLDTMSQNNEFKKQEKD